MLKALSRALRGPATVSTRPKLKRLVLIGTGFSARKHAEAVGKEFECEEIAAYSPRAESRMAFQRDFPHAHVFDSPEAMLAAASPEGEIVVVASTPDVHARHAILALASGRAVLCEKPLALSLDDADRIVQAADTHGVPLACCSARYAQRPGLIRARREIEAGRIGNLLQVTWRMRQHAARAGIDYQPSSPWFADPRRSGGGCLMDWGSYDFSTLAHLLHPVRVEVQHARVHRFEIEGQPPEATGENWVAAALTYIDAEGQAITVQYERSNWGFAAEEQRPLIEGTRGAITWDWLDWLGDEVAIVGRQQGSVKKTVLPPVGEYCPPDMVRPFIYFSEHIQGADRMIDFGSDARASLALIHAVYDVARDGQRRTVHWPSRATRAM